MIGIVGNIYEYFLGFREHATEFLGTGELNESEFQGSSLGNKEGQGRNSNFFVGNKAT